MRTKFEENGVADEAKRLELYTLEAAKFELARLKKERFLTVCFLVRYFHDSFHDSVRHGDSAFDLGPDSKMNSKLS